MWTQKFRRVHRRVLRPTFFGVEKGVVTTFAVVVALAIGLVKIVVVSGNVIAVWT